MCMQEKLSHPVLHVNFLYYIGPLASCLIEIHLLTETRRTV